MKNKNSGRNSGKTFSKAGKPMRFKATPVPTGPRSLKMFLYPEAEAIRNIEAEIRFILDESVDETCDPTYGRYVGLRNVKLDGRKVLAENLSKGEDGKTFGIRVGQINIEKEVILSLNFDLPEDVILGDEEKVVLQAEMVRRKSGKSMSKGDIQK